MQFKNILIIGLGLVGGSFAKHLKRKSTQIEILAYDSNIKSLKEALNEKIIDKIFDFNNKTLKIDLIIIATPLSQYHEIFDQIKLINCSPLIIDFGSVKNFNFNNIPSNFIGCHPIAGSHNYGYKNSNYDIFTNKKIIICQKHDDLMNFFRSIDLHPIFLDSKIHDKIYALISHLPQFISFMLHELSPKEIDPTYEKIFRLGDSEHDNWHDIFTFNNNNIEHYYYKFFENLEQNLNIIENSNYSKIIDKSLLLCEKFNITNNSLDWIFFKNNFSLLFFRFIIIISYIEIIDVEKYHEFCGSGFRDFISLLSVIRKNSVNISQLISQHKIEINNLFLKIS